MNHNSTKLGPYVGESELGGRGVFAARPYRYGEIVEDCPLLQVNIQEIGSTLMDFVYTGYKRNTVLVVLGYGMLYNHSPKANLSYVKISKNELRFIATRSIRSGEELTINYGASWWRSRSRRPVYDSWKLSYVSVEK